MRKRKGLCFMLSVLLCVALALPASAAEAGDFAKEVEALPRLETVKTLSKAEQQALYGTIDEIWENCFYAQSGEEQKKMEALPQFAVLKAITEYLNEAQVAPLQWLDCGQLRLAGEDLKDGEDYAYDANAKELVILSKKPITVTAGKDGGVSTDTLRTKDEAEITLCGVTIQAEAGKSALAAEKGLKLVLVGKNTLTAQDHAAISVEESVTLSGTGALTAQGGTGADGIGAKTVNITGGMLDIRGGDGTPGTLDAEGGDGGNAVGADTMTVTGGSLKLTAGKAGTDGGKGAGEDGKQTTCMGPTEDQKPVKETKLQLTDGEGKAVAGKALTALTLTPEDSYGMNGVVTDDEGTVYLYLPENTQAVSVSDGIDTYAGDPVASGSAGVLTLSTGGQEQPKEEPKEEPKEQPKEEPKEEPKEQPKEEPKEQPKEEPKQEPAENPQPTPDPTPAPKAAQAAPTLELESKTASSVTLKEVKGIGTAMYAYGSTSEKPDTNWVETRTFIDLTPGKTYYFFAYFIGDDNTNPSDKSQALAVTLDGGFSAADVSVQGAEKTYDGKSLSVSVSIPSGSTIRFRENDTGDYTLTTAPSYTNAGTYHVGYQVTKEGYDAVSGMVTVQINPATPTATIKDLTFKHDGKTHPMEGIKVTGVNGESYKGGIIYNYYTDEALTKGQTTTPPSAVGTYYVRAYIPAGGNYTDAVSNIAKLTIEKSTTTSNTTTSSTTKPTTGNTTGSTTTTGKTYTVTATAGTGGTISQSGKVSVQSGKSASFTIVADKNYEVEDVKVDGKSMGSVGVYTFTDVKADHTIEATFRRSVAETTAPTTEPTTAPTTAPDTVPTESVPAATEETQKPAKKKGVPIIVPILLVILAGGALGGAVYVYRKYNEQGQFSEKE